MSGTIEVIELTKEQQEVVNLAGCGHNICVFGRAGVGKTTVVKEIRRVLNAQGKECQIVSSSGISCNPYNGVARTVHSHYGLQTAELPDHQVIERALGRENVVKDVTSTHAIIWDEISMSSERIFNLINMIQHSVSDNSHPFGGVQMILVGDFWQLKPIPGPFDDGKLIYSSELFNRAFPHRFELTTIMRQGQDEETLKNALDEIRMGDCTDETEKYLQSLSRECTSGSDDNTRQETVHLFFKKLPASLLNLNVLAELPGEFLKYDSQDTGHGQCLENSINKILALKRGCNVMLLYNINDNLRNGSQGKFVGGDPKNKECLVVNFPKVGNVSISRRTWYKYDENGKVKASRTQFPIIPSYAITVHKAQSLTLSRVVVHCSQEFVAGQTYVALSRVTRESSLQVFIILILLSNYLRWLNKVITKTLLKNANKTV
jgi:ATP-dependent DNA helicase PIF1